MARKKPREFTLQISDQISARLHAEAKKNHHPVSEEIRWRLEVMFATENYATTIFGGETNLKFIVRIAGAISRAEQRMGRRWFTDYSAIIQTKSAVMQEMSDYVLIEQLGFERPKSDG